MHNSKTPFENLNNSYSIRKLDLKIKAIPANSSRSSLVRLRCGLSGHSWLSILCKMQQDSLGWAFTYCSIASSRQLHLYGYRRLEMSGSGPSCRHRAPFGEVRELPVVYIHETQLAVRSWMCRGTRRPIRHSKMLIKPIWLRIRFPRCLLSVSSNFS